jgi:hypothetical protein
LSFGRQPYFSIKLPSASLKTKTPEVQPHGGLAGAQPEKLFWVDDDSRISIFSHGKAKSGCNRPHWSIFARIFR